VIKQQKGSLVEHANTQIGESQQLNSIPDAPMSMDKSLKMAKTPKAPKRAETNAEDHSSLTLTQASSILWKL